MADYSALWTSSSDPEFQQLKKVKVDSERKLAVRLSEVEKEHRLRIKKIQQEIRHNQGTLIKLQVEKEERARHLLDVFIKHRRPQAAALYNEDIEHTPTKVTWASRLENMINNNDNRQALENTKKLTKQRCLRDARVRKIYNTRVIKVDTEVNNNGNYHVSTDVTLQNGTRTKLLNRDATAGSKRKINISSFPISNEITGGAYKVQSKSPNKCSKKNMCVKNISRAGNKSGHPSGNDALSSCDKPKVNLTPVRDKHVSFHLGKIPKIRTLTLFQLNSYFGQKSNKTNVTKTLQEVEGIPSKISMSTKFPRLYHSGGEMHCTRYSRFHN